MCLSDFFPVDIVMDDNRLMAVQSGEGHTHTHTRTHMDGGGKKKWIDEDLLFLRFGGIPFGRIVVSSLAKDRYWPACHYVIEGSIRGCPGSLLAPRRNPRNQDRPGEFPNFGLFQPIIRSWRI